MLDEKAASVELVAQIKEKKLKCYEYLKYLSRLSSEQLISSGYGGKTAAEAVKMSLDRTVNEIEKLIQAHERKYPI